MAFWWRVLAFVGIYLMVFGMTLVVFPNFTMQIFGLIIYANEASLFGYAGNAVNYIKLIHAVLGAVIVCWGALVFLIVLKVAPTQPKIAWQLVMFTMLAWLVTDTAYSLISGFWQNAVFNLPFAFLFALPLGMIKSKYLNSQFSNTISGL
jgi:hypothetical protein